MSDDQCQTVIEITWDTGGVGFQCGLTEGHAGTHIQTGESDSGEEYTILWLAQESR